MYKISLVQISDQIDNNVLLPLAIGVLWATATQQPEIRSKWKLRSIVHRPDTISKEIAELSDCEMVCFSTYTWNHNYHLDLAQSIKKRNPDCMTVFGGPHFNEKWPDFWHMHGDAIDLVILGEGEDAFSQLLLAFPDRDKIHDVPGAWSRSHVSDTAPRIILENHNASPYLEGFYANIVQSCHEQNLTIQATIQTNRGCPYHCTFCEEGAAYKNKIHQYKLEKILQEIEWCGKNQIEYLNIADDNFGILDRDIEIMEKICLTAKRYGYPKILDATYAKNNPTNVLELARLDRRHGTNLIRGITVALQSQNLSTLQTIRRFNLQEKKQNNFLSQLNQLQMPTYAEMIWPLPFETFESFCCGIDQTVSQGLDNWIGVYPLSLQPTTDLHRDFKNHYKFPDNTGQSTSAKSHIKNYTPIASDWADHDAVVRGQVFYTWLTTLYFFGFARPVIDFLQSTLSISQAINSFIQHIEKLDVYHPFKAQHDKLIRFWSAWLRSHTTPSLSQFETHNTDFWYPYSHHAAWCQINRQLLYECLADWLSKKFNEQSYWHVFDQCNHSAVQYGINYPYRHHDLEISLRHDQPKFADIFEFCRYYYWYNRKKGYSRTLIKKTHYAD